MSPKWTRTKFVIEISLSLQAYCLYRGATGSSAHILKFSLQLALFSLCMAMRILFSIFWLAICIFKTLKCQAAIFNRCCLAGVNGQIISLWHAIKSWGQPACLCEIFRVLNCEAVIFDKYRSACANGMSISNSWHARVASLPVCTC